MAFQWGGFYPNQTSGSEIRAVRMLGDKKADITKKFQPYWNRVNGWKTNNTTIQYMLLKFGDSFIKTDLKTVKLQETAFRIIFFSVWHSTLAWKI